MLNGSQTVHFVFVITTCSVTPVHSFVDYIKGGCQINLLVAIDFTVSYSFILVQVPGTISWYKFTSLRNEWGGGQMKREGKIREESETNEEGRANGGGAGKRATKLTR